MSGSTPSARRLPSPGAALGVLIALCLCLVPALLRAYVISATLEYTVDNVARIYLNGHLVLANSGDHYPDYAVLSTSDGTLPLRYFVPNKVNLLAVEDTSLRGGGLISISYRLTVNHSNGDPVVVWSVPQNTKLLHLSAGQPEPEGWYEPGFDDAQWQRAVKMTFGTAWYTYPTLPDPAFGGILGFQGVVPHISYSTSGMASSGDRNLFRNRFSFPDTRADTRILVNPASADRGQGIAVRLLPGRDAADMTQFSMYADLPRGLALVSAPGASVYDRSTNQVGWFFPNGGLNSVRYVSLPAQTVIAASGWGDPEKVLGGAKPDHPTGWYHQSIPDYLYMDGATFYPGSTGVFGLAKPDPAVENAYPVILGVIFHGQMMAGGQNTDTVTEVDDFRLNYSVSPDGRKVLKKGVRISRVSYAKAWFDGYYDASTDMHWTWADLRNVRVYIDAEARGDPDKNRVASVWAVVRCFRPQDTAPVFYARVMDDQCEKLDLKAGLYSKVFGYSANDFTLPVNQGYCATPTPVPTIAMQASLYAPAPTATPTPNPGMVLRAGLEVLGLGCLNTSPEPFNYAGVFIKFCLKKAARVRVDIYDSSNTLVRQLDGGSFNPGEDEVFYDAQDSKHQTLAPGAYQYEIYATDGTASAQREGSFTRAADTGQ